MCNRKKEGNANEKKIITSVSKTPKLQNAAMLQPELAPAKLKQPAKPTNFILDF